MSFKSRFVPNQRYKQGYFIPNNLNKYKFEKGENSIIYRSSWELKFLKYCDESEHILKYNSEGLKIPYLNPFTQRISNYYPDFIVTYRTVSGNIKTAIVELKPFKETQKPTKPKRLTDKAFKNYIYNQETYIKNVAKWLSCKEYCKNNNIDFFIITEKTSNFF